MNNSDSSSRKFSRKTRLLALMSKLCPTCNAGRLFPTSELGRRLQQRRSGCPACKAYRQVYAPDEEEEESQK